MGIHGEQWELQQGAGPSLVCGGIWVGFSEEEEMLNWDQEGEENMVARQKKKKNNGGRPSR